LSDTDLAWEMATTPFELHIESIFPQKNRRTVICRELLREIPHNRSVYAATFDDNQVIAKIYRKGLRAKRRVLNEWSKLERLAQKGLDCPKPHFYGRSEQGDWVIIVERIKNAATARQLRLEDQSVQAGVRILRPLFAALARLNRAGVLQKDLHLGNFLMSGEKVYSLDTATMRFQKGPLSRSQSLRQLAILTRYVPKEAQEQLPELLQEYGEVRGWDITRADEKSIKRFANKQARAEIRRQLKKTLRTSGRQVRIRRDNLIAVFDRRFCSGFDTADFLSGIDGLLETGEVLKRQNTSFLSQVLLNGQHIVIKRHNYKGLWHSIRRSLVMSRARRSWLAGHRLRMLGVNTPRPLAYIEKRTGPLLWQSYIITEYVAGPNLRRFLADAQQSAERKEEVRRQIDELMNCLHRNRITHGDFKRTNFIVTEKNVYITDLDGMKVHLRGPLVRRRISKDIMRFERMFPKDG
jgi:tRNA A-37 threonylcarbamoyl transferase component Bud32